MIKYLLAAAMVGVILVGVGLVARLFRLKFFPELLAKENLAFALCLAGFVLGLTVGLSGLFFGPLSEDRGLSLLNWACEAALVLMLMMLTAAVTEWLLLPGLPVVEEITRDQNLGVALATAGSFVSAGLVIQGSLSGHSPSESLGPATSLMLAIRDVVIYWALAQAAIWTTLRVLIATRPFDCVAQLRENDNLASGLSLGLFLVCLGVLGRAAVIYSGGVKDVSVWMELADSAMRWFVGLAVLLIVVAALKLVLLRRGIRPYDFELANSPAPVLALGIIQIAAAVAIGLALERS